MRRTSQTAQRTRRHTRCTRRLRMSTAQTQRRGTWVNTQGLSCNTTTPGHFKRKREGRNEGNIRMEGQLGRSRREQAPRGQVDERTHLSSQSCTPLASHCLRLDTLRRRGMSNTQGLPTSHWPTSPVVPRHTASSSAVAAQIPLRSRENPISRHNITTRRVQRTTTHAMCSKPIITPPPRTAVETL